MLLATLLLINDLPNVSRLTSWLFADDTALAVAAENFQDLELQFNTEVNKVHNWLLANRLSVHYTEKTKFMLIQGPNVKDKGSDENFTLKMGNHVIEKTNNYKYLGVIVDDHLNWKCHIDKLCSKLSSVCGVLSKVRHYLDRNSLLLIYNSLFDSRIRYGLLGWGTSCEKYLAKIRVLQNRAIRFITFASFRTSVAPLYSKLKILPLNEQVFLQRSIFMHGLHYKNLPFALSEYCTRPEHRYPTRYNAAGNYVLPKATTNRGQNSIKYNGPKAWVEVPTNLKEIAFRKPFSKKLKDHVLEKIHVDMPPNRMRTKKSRENDNCLEDLRALFESDDDEEEFFGFYSTKTDDLACIFLEESLMEEFLGF